MKKNLPKLALVILTDFLLILASLIAKARAGIEGHSKVMWQSVSIQGKIKKTGAVLQVICTELYCSYFISLQLDIVHISIGFMDLVTHNLLIIFPMREEFFDLTSAFKKEYCLYSSPYSPSSGIWREVSFI